MAKKSQKRAGAKRTRPAGTRDLVRRPKASTYAKHTARGRFNELDDVGRSQKADKPRTAKRTQHGDSMLMRTAEWAGATAGYASRQLTKGFRAAASTIRLPQNQSPKKAPVPGERRGNENTRHRGATKTR